MPKIIENLREQLLCEARRQITEKGYSAVTVRSVAGACGVGIGTVYNYFRSKDMLIATFMLEDWHECIGRITEQSKNALDADGILRCIYNELRTYLDKHANIFSDPQAIKVFAGVFTDRHKQLRQQIAEPIRTVLSEKRTDNADFTAEFIAEAIITWTVAGKSYTELSPLLLCLFNY